MQMTGFINYLYKAVKENKIEKVLREKNPQDFFVKKSRQEYIEVHILLYGKKIYN